MRSKRCTVQNQRITLSIAQCLELDMAYILEILRKPGLIRVCLHYNMNRNAIRFILAVPAEHLKRAITICYTTTSFTFKYEVYKLEQS